MIKNIKTRKAMKIFKLILLSSLLILCCIACAVPPYKEDVGTIGQVDAGINRQVNPSPVNPGLPPI
ncbi:MAG: hypothetical protein K1060chlam4_00829 [Candidatus Anoxychlamydiales bacterium]|nr:hypothetical protein [Candidatus Anoxychlamydiales bacterium]